MIRKVKKYFGLGLLVLFVSCITIGTVRRFARIHKMDDISKISECDVRHEYDDANKIEKFSSPNFADKPINFNSNFATRFASTIDTRNVDLTFDD